VPDADLLDRWAVDDAKTWPEWLHARGASDGAIALMTLGGDSRKLSALYVLRQMAHMPASGEFYKISGGMDRLAHALALRAGDRVRYGARVVRVDVTPEAAHVEYTQRDRTIVLRASRVVFTIPFSTLRRVDIRPPLRPDKAGVIAELPYYPATRLLLQTRSPFWADRDLSGAARTDDPAEFWDAAYETGGPRGLLAATLGAAPALELGDLTESAALARGVALAARSFPSVSRELETGRVVRWALDPWAAGAFAVYHAGQMTSWLPHVSRAEGRLHFAGEHSSAWMGWMEGALESAERVAREVLV
jgi:monoamine oxidase